MDNKVVDKYFDNNVLEISKSDILEIFIAFNNISAPHIGQISKLIKAFDKLGQSNNKIIESLQKIGENQDFINTLNGITELMNKYNSDLNSFQKIHMEQIKEIEIKLAKIDKLVNKVSSQFNISSDSKEMDSSDNKGGSVTFLDYVILFSNIMLWITILLINYM